MTNSKYPTPVVPNISSIYSNSISGKPVPQKRSESDGVSGSGGNGRNSSAKTRQNATSRSGSGNTTENNHQGNHQKKPKLPELKPTFSTFKQFHRTASLSDLINEDDTLVVKPEVTHKNTNIIKKSRKHQQNTTNQNHHKTTTSNKNIPNLDTESLASVNVNIPEPVLPPTKSITVQTDEALDLNLEDFGISNRYLKFLIFSFSPNLGNVFSLRTIFA